MRFEVREYELDSNHPFSFTGFGIHDRIYDNERKEFLPTMYVGENVHKYAEKLNQTRPQIVLKSKKEQ
jgi:hypothetical protein